MAEKKIRVNTDSLERTRRELQEKIDRIKRDIDHISEDMETLNTMWMGDAHSAFEQNVQEDIQFLHDVCSGIQNIIGYEGTAVSEYNKCERQVSEIISQIRI